MRRALLWAQDIAYRTAVRPFLFTGSAQKAHDQMIARLPALDQANTFIRAAHLIRRALRQPQPVRVGGVDLHYPSIVAAGLVKGHGFATEDDAMSAVQRSENIVPGWRAIPALLGAVEFGSYTRQPRTGNPGVVIWRDTATCSTQNRVGLKNPGAAAAAAFLALNQANLPPVYGINIAVSPGITAVDDQTQDLTECLDLFLNAGLHPSWFTLNVSCPNTEDDPTGNQTEALTQALCRTAIERLHSAEIPLWVKISPNLTPAQYNILMRVFAEEGVAAVIATNTLGQPAPTDSTLQAGVGGGRLHRHALAAVTHLIACNRALSNPVDIIGCGGVMTREDFVRFRALGINAVQYYSALVYHGPFAAYLFERG